MATNTATGRSPFSPRDFTGRFWGPFSLLAHPSASPLWTPYRSSWKLLAPSVPAHRGPSPSHSCARRTGTTTPPVTHLAADPQPRPSSSAPALVTIVLGCCLSPGTLPAARPTWPTSWHLKACPEEAPGQAFLKQPNRAAQQELKAAAFHLLEKW